MRWALDEIYRQAKATSANVRGKVIDANADGSLNVRYRNGTIRVPAGTAADGQWINLTRTEGGGFVPSEDSAYPGGA